MNMSNHLMAINDHPTDTRRKVTATKRKITDMSNKSMVTTIKSTDISKRGMDTNVRTTAISNHLTEGTKRAVVMAKPDMEIRVMEPDMDKLDTEIMVTSKLHTQVATM